MSNWTVTVERTLVADFDVEADDKAAALAKGEAAAAYTDTEDFDRLWDRATWAKEER